MTSYVTTRGAEPVDLATAVLRGLGPDGGLYVPRHLPRLPTDFAVECGLDADDARPVAAWAAPALFPSVSRDLIAGVARHSVDFPIPLVEVEAGKFVLELFHGPTFAFKDVGARFMAGLMKAIEPDCDRTRTVLVATSGDTGGAVANAFHGSDGIRVTVLFPSRGVSDTQRRQMTTLGGNVAALEVQGSFDDCQAMVKAAFQDEGRRARYHLTSANSINVARLLPQALYYVHAVHRLGTAEDFWPRVAPHFVVPSGNLGNLCAGLFAARAGMPVAGFTAAVNANRGFADFLNGAAFIARRPVRTQSNAMDVGAPSNLERIRWLYGQDEEALRREVRGVSITDSCASECMARVHGRTGYVLDPHSAVAYEAAEHAPSGTAPVVVLATAHPGKFPEAVEAAIGRPVAVPSALADSLGRPEHVTRVEANVDALYSALNELGA